MFFNEFFEAKDADEAFEHWWQKLSNDSEGSSFESRDGNIVGEVINATTVIKDPTRCVMKNKIRNMPMRYAVGELLWYVSANPKLKPIRMFTSAWDRMSDDGEHVNSNYGYCIKSKFGFDQYSFVKQLLKEDKNTRQAVIHIKEPRNLINYPTKDVNCTIALQFFIRDCKLYETAYMRSNDLWMGFPYDVFQFTALQVLLAMELGVDLGTYTHVAGSLHLYERDFEKGKKNEVSINV